MTTEMSYNQRNVYQNNYHGMNPGHQGFYQQNYPQNYNPNFHQGQYYVPNMPAQSNFSPVGYFQDPSMVQAYPQQFNQHNYYSHSNRGRGRGNISRGNYGNYRGQRSRPSQQPQEAYHEIDSTEYEIDLENKMDDYIETVNNQEDESSGDGKKKLYDKSDKKSDVRPKSQTYSNSRYKQSNGAGTLNSDDKGTGVESSSKEKQRIRGDANYNEKGGTRPKSSNSYNGRRGYDREYRQDDPRRMDGGRSYNRNRDNRYGDRDYENKENSEYYNSDRQYFDEKRNTYSRKAEFEKSSESGRKHFDNRKQYKHPESDLKKSTGPNNKKNLTEEESTSENSGAMVSLKKEGQGDVKRADSGGTGKDSVRQDTGRGMQPARGHKKPPVLRTVSGRVDESQRGVLIDQLTMGTYECMVCCETIRGQNAVWNCGNCYHAFHLRCIKQWARSPAAKVEGSDNGWRCPACQNVCDRFPNQYRCYCGKVRDPEWNRMDTPHSCGEVCRKSRGNNCSHPCNLLCHPGPCPPCSAVIKRSCQCGKTSQTSKCSNVDVIQCDKVCGKQLNCGKHFCSVKCHGGACEPCAEIIVQKCFGGHSTREVTCGSKESFTEQYSCGIPCNKVLTCGNHRCEQICHPGDCDLCERLPSEVNKCPCGQTDLSEIGDEERKSCLDPIPTCKNICGKILLCGSKDRPHACQQRCHEGPCGDCSGTTQLRCRCGALEKTFTCIEAAQFKDEPFQCDKRCNKKRSCGRHKCGLKCCVKDEHPCDLICGKKLSCGLHKCDEPCHRGNCPPCLMAGFDEVTCHCGSEIMYPPIPCGAKPPECKKPCTRQHSCDHPVLHNCHSDESCPPCTALTTKWCMGGHEERKNIPCHVTNVSCGLPCGKELKCGQHKCKKKCHSGACELDGEECQQPCLYKRKECEHACMAPCHSGSPCPDVPCKAEIKVKCACGNKEAKVPCQIGGSEMAEFQKMTMQSLASSLQSGQSVDITQLTGKKTGKRQLECDSECALLERNRRVALALEIKNPDLSAKLGNPSYSEFLRDYAKSNPHIVASIEKALRDLVQNAKKAKQSYRSHSFPSGNRDQRRLIHELAECYGCETQSYDFEPKKNVVATAHKDKCWLPSVTLTQYVQREQHPKAPPPIPHNYSETAIRQSALAAKQSFEVLKDRPIKSLPKGQSSTAQTSSTKEAGKQKAAIDYFDFSTD